MVYINERFCQIFIIFSSAKRCIFIKQFCYSYIINKKNKKLKPASNLYSRFYLFFFFQTLCLSLDYKARFLQSCYNHPATSFKNLDKHIIRFNGPSLRAGISSNKPPSASGGGSAPWATNHGQLTHSKKTAYDIKRLLFSHAIYAPLRCRSCTTVSYPTWPAPRTIGK